MAPAFSTSLASLAGSALISFREGRESFDNFTDSVLRS